MENLELFRDEEFETDRVANEFDLFEAMDRASQVFEHLERALYNHPGLDEEQAHMADQAFGLLFEIYQRAGAKFFDTQENKDDKDSTQG